MSDRGIVISPPKGPIARKYNDVVWNWSFAEEGVCGPQGTAKSNALVDLIMAFGTNVPGANILFARATLTSLKGSALQLLVAKYGMAFDGTSDSGSKNMVEGRLTFPTSVHPRTGAPVQSTIRAIGLDRPDIEQHMKSTEFSLIVLEEADEIRQGPWDFLLGRNRQQVWHARETVQNMCSELALQWGIPWQEVYEVLLGDSRHPVGQNQLKLHDPRPVMPILKAAWNPSGNEPTWKRFCVTPYPIAPAFPTPEWVSKYVGIREKHIDPVELNEFRGTGGADFIAGDIVRIQDGAAEEGYVRRIAARVDRENGVVRLVRDPANPDAPLSVSLDDAWMIKQRNLIYVFPEENLSRNFQNDGNMFLMEDAGIMRRALLGEESQTSGSVFPTFRNEFVSQGGHVLPWNKKARLHLERQALRFVGGIDQGGSHHTAVVGMVYYPRYDILVVFDEHVVRNEAASTTATTIMNMPLGGSSEVVWGYDPAMEAKGYQFDTEFATVDIYKQFLGEENMIPGDRGEMAFDAVNERLLSGQDNPALSFEYVGPRLLVYEHCVHVRETLETLTWKMVGSQRDKWVVDVGDALKIAVTAHRKELISRPKVPVGDMVALLRPKGLPSAGRR